MGSYPGPKRFSVSKQRAVTVLSQESSHKLRRAQESSQKLGAARESSVELREAQESLGELKTAWKSSGELRRAPDSAGPKQLGTAPNGPGGALPEKCASRTGGWTRRCKLLRIPQKKSCDA